MGILCRGLLGKVRDAEARVGGGHARRGSGRGGAVGPQARHAGSARCHGHVRALKCDAAARAAALEGVEELPEARAALTRLVDVVREVDNEGRIADGLARAEHRVAEPLLLRLHDKGDAAPELEDARLGGERSGAGEAVRVARAQPLLEEARVVDLVLGLHDDEDALHTRLDELGDGAHDRRDGRHAVGLEDGHWGGAGARGAGQGEGLCAAHARSSDGTALQAGKKRGVKAAAGTAA